jgi:hypothetical protein
VVCEGAPCAIAGSEYTIDIPTAVLNKYLFVILSPICLLFDEAIWVNLEALFGRSLTRGKRNWIIGKRIELFDPALSAKAVVAF